MRRISLKLILSSMLIAGFAVMGVQAGGPLFIWDSRTRTPYRWSVITPVPVYTDLGPFEIIPPPHVPIPPAVADGIVNFAVAEWTNVETSSFQAQVVGDFGMVGLPDITSANAASLIGARNSGGIYVVYDADGTIIRDFFGAPLNVLGIASPEWADESTGTITEGWVVINAQSRFVGDDLLLNYAAVFTHEFGHSINLAHSQTNGAIAFFNNARGPATCTTLPYDPNTITINHVETMYPFINPRPGTGSGIAQSTVDIADDKSAVSDLYPAPGYPDARGSVTGRILQTAGNPGITGVNIIARNVDDPFADAVSAMSGDWIRVSTGDDGSFTINGLTPGARYAIYTDGIAGGGFPTSQPFYIPGPEEFFNGPNESGNGLTDDRCQSSTVTVGGRSAGSDIILNSVAGAPELVPLPPGTLPATISGDGRIIGGNISNGPPFRLFTETGAVEVLGNSAVANAVMSRDGTAFAADTPGPAPGGRIASLLQGGFWRQLPVPVPEPPVTASPCGDTSAGYGVSGFGRAFAGHFWVDLNGSEPGQGCRVRPFIWTRGTGSRVLSTPANAASSRPNNMSEDGSTVVGWYDKPTSSLRLGIIWRNGTFLDLSTPTFTVGEAYNTTPDGSVVVGLGAGPAREPWRWTNEGGVETLGRLFPFGSAGASAVSDDGNVVAGLGGSSSPFPGDVSGRRPFLWLSGVGMLNFEDFLRSQGTFFEGWLLNSATSMSSDGTEIVGVGFSPRGQGGWLIKMDRVNICHASRGNPAPETMNVEFPTGMKAHLDHGDTVGFCQ